MKRDKKTTWKTVVLFVVGLVIACSATAFAADPIYVGPGEKYKTIQDGINAIRGGATGTVIVRDGTYSGPGNYNITIVRKPITVRSESNDPAKCTINCIAADGTVVNNGFVMYAVVTNGITIQGFTVRNAVKAVSIDTQAKAAVNNCILKGNGTGIWCSHFAAANATLCTITENTVGIDCSCNSSPAIVNCNITANTDGVRCSTGARPAVQNCDILNNTGYGLFCTNNASPTVNNGTAITGNKVGVSCASSSNPSLKGCDISGNKEAGIHCNNASSPVIDNCNVSGGAGVGIRMNSSCSPTINGCDISGNPGGGINCTGNCSPKVSNCDISGNGNPSINGGGIFCTNSCSPVITNCVIDGNIAQYGGGINCQCSGAAVMTNCTLYKNVASKGAGLRCANAATLWVTNCIIWDESPLEVFVETQGNPQVNYCDVLGWPAGVGNIYAVPEFVDSTSGNYHLSADSPCVDAGTDTDPNLPASDKDGQPRVQGDDVDMGAYECF
ncbi:MAG: right-handed parallel beta-helix repeat-containing protein [Candidatus Latescibacterota bacterium]